MSGSKKIYDGKMDENVKVIYRYYLTDPDDRTSSDYVRMCVGYYILTTELKPIEYTHINNHSGHGWEKLVKWPKKICSILKLKT
jgi:hypothetical protein